MIYVMRGESMGFKLYFMAVTVDQVAEQLLKGWSLLGWAEDMVAAERLRVELN